MTSRGLRPAACASAGRCPFVEGAVDALGDQMDDTFHALAALYLSRTDDIMELFGSGPGTLIHGDAHIGNLFVDVGNDRTGFLDWAVVCRAPGIRDVAYAMCNSVQTTVRVAIEHEIVAHYCDRLAALGVTLDPDVASGPVPPLRGAVVGVHHRDRGCGIEVATDRDQPRGHAARDRSVCPRRQCGPARRAPRMTRRW